MTDSLHLVEQAERCKRLARSCADAQTEACLRLLAQEYLQQARELGGSNSNVFLLRPAAARMPERAAPGRSA